MDFTEVFPDLFVGSHLIYFLYYLLHTATLPVSSHYPFHRS